MAFALDALGTDPATGVTWQLFRIAYGAGTPAGAVLYYDGVPKAIALIQSAQVATITGTPTIEDLP